MTNEAGETTNHYTGTAPLRKIRGRSDHHKPPYFHDNNNSRRRIYYRVLPSTSDLPLLTVVVLNRPISITLTPLLLRAHGPSDSERVEYSRNHGYVHEPDGVGRPFCQQRHRRRPGQMLTMTAAPKKNQQKMSLGTFLQDDSTLLLRHSSARF